MTAPVCTPLPFPTRRLNRRAVSVVRRLQSRGFEAYLVGGCVRDLLLGSSPKDFDIATSARPHQVRRLFRRSRLIGRRFRIVHVLEGPEMFEVSTFRGSPPAEQEDLDPADVEMIRHDNQYGTAEEDAFRRDFTVNALFLDPVERVIVDWVGGFPDLEQDRLRSIGDPAVRFAEDPVRMLRLIKFMRRLGLQPGQAEVAACKELAGRVGEAAPARVAEELFRLMATGDMHGVMHDLEGLDIVPLVMPEIYAWLSAKEEHRLAFHARLRGLDDFIEEGGEVDYDLSLAVLFGVRAEQEYNPDTRRLPIRETAQVAPALIGPFQQRARLPRQQVAWAARMLQAQLALDPPEYLSERRRRRASPQRWFGDAWFPRALDYLEIRLRAEGRSLDLVKDWRERALSKAEEPR